MSIPLGFLGLPLDLQNMCWDYQEELSCPRISWTTHSFSQVDEYALSYFSSLRPKLLNLSFFRTVAASVEVDLKKATLQQITQVVEAAWCVLGLVGIPWKVQSRGSVLTLEVAQQEGSEFFRPISHLAEEWLPHFAHWDFPKGVAFLLREEIYWKSPKSKEKAFRTALRNAIWYRHPESLAVLMPHNLSTRKERLGILKFAICRGDPALIALVVGEGEWLHFEQPLERAERYFLRQALSYSLGYCGTLDPEPIRLKTLIKKGSPLYHYYRTETPQFLRAVLESERCKNWQEAASLLCEALDLLPKGIFDV